MISALFIAARAVFNEGQALFNHIAAIVVERFGVQVQWCICSLLVHIQLHQRANTLIGRLKYKGHISAVNNVPEQQREQCAEHFAFAVHAVPATFQFVELQREFL